MNNPSAIVTTRGDLVRDLNDLLQLSNVLMKSGLLPAGIKTPEAAAVIILKGRELGIGAMEAFAGINVISGKPTISPQLMLALINRSGLMEDLSINDDGKTCVVGMTRKGRKTHVERFSMEDAARMTTQEKGETISLANKYNWRSMPTVMRKWRAISACARVVFPDVIEGLYLPEEMGAEVDEEGEIVDAVAVTTSEPPSPIQQSTNVANPVKIMANVTAADGNGPISQSDPLQKELDEQGKIINATSSAKTLGLPDDHKFAKPQPTNGKGKRAVPVSAHWVRIIDRAIKAGYIPDNSTGSGIRLLNVIGAAGIETVNDSHLDEAWTAIKAHYEAKKTQAA